MKANELSKSAHAQELVNAHGGKVVAVYEEVLSGFAIEMPEHAAEALARNPLVRFVEEDIVIRATSVTSSTQSTGNDPENGLWHLDRIDERQVDDGGLDGVYGYCSSGDGVVVYILDTGIQRDHSELGTVEVLDGVDMTDVDNNPDTVLPDLGSPTDPCRTPATYPTTVPDGGHGTAVASVLAGATFGVAKNATLVPVRVLDCQANGLNSWVIDGLDWIRSSANPSRDLSVTQLINMSFVAPEGDTEALHQAIKDVNGYESTTADDHFLVFVSANNNNEDAGLKAPAKYSEVVTVGGTKLVNNRDYRWEKSSYGPSVDIWAPADGFKVADYRAGFPNEQTQEDLNDTWGEWRIDLAGTSFSSPIVAGIAARLLERDPYMSPDELWSEVTARAVDKDTTDQPLIWENSTTTLPGAFMVHMKDSLAGRCRPVRRVSITKQPSSWTLPAGSQVTLTVETDEVAEYQWYLGVSGDATQPVWGATDAAFTTPPLATTTSYWVNVIGETNAVNSSTATITPGTCPTITITAHPVGATIVEGESATLSVSASSVNPLSYQWTGSWPVSDPTQPTITVSPTQLSSFSARISNGCRASLSNWAYVYVAKEHLVAFKTYYDNYIGADNCGGSGVHAYATSAGACERFILRDLNGGQLLHGDSVTLRAQSGHYVVAEWGGGPGQTVSANRTAPGPWETFTILSMDGNSTITHGSDIALETSGGYYVVAEYGGLNGGGPGAGEVNCDRTDPNEWETFSIRWQ